MDVCQHHLIIVSDGKVKIYEKMTGKELYSGNPLSTRHGPIFCFKNKKL